MFLVKFYKHITLFSFLAFFPAFIPAQLDRLYLPPPDHIKSAVCSINDYPYINPIASIDEYLFISFDDLEADQKTYYYRIRRFDQNWQASSLLPMEYIDGYDTDYIPNEENSQATLQSYTHYSFKIPNANTRITKSGNYLIEILDEDEEPVFNFPVIIYEKTISVSVQVQRPVEPAKMHSHQFVKFWLNTGDFHISDPSNDLTVKLYKNENLFEHTVFHAPTFHSGNRLEYHFPYLSVFPGGDEFLHFETRDLRGYNPGLDSLRLKDYYHAYITPYLPRRLYVERKDIDGSFVIDSFQAEDDATESDYISVHFRLPPQEVPSGKDIYVVGRFNNWQADNRSRLRFNKETGLYETSFRLKQGYYDYYFVGKNADGSLDWTAVYPSFSETENRYTVVVYYHPPGARYTRVLGIGQAVSKPLK